MALQPGAMRDVLIDAGAMVEKAEKAAEELAGYRNRLTGIDRHLSVLKGMAGLNLGLSLILLGTVFMLRLRVDEISGHFARLTR